MSKSDKIVEEIRNFFEPSGGIAVIGASNTKGKVGNAIITNLTKEVSRKPGSGRLGFLQKEMR